MLIQTKCKLHYVASENFEENVWCGICLWAFLGFYQWRHARTALQQSNHYATTNVPEFYNELRVDQTPALVENVFTLQNIIQKQYLYYEMARKKAGLTQCKVRNQFKTLQRQKRAHLLHKISCTITKQTSQLHADIIPKTGRLTLTGTSTYLAAAFTFKIHEQNTS